jgi:hypothetical protein
LKIFQKALPAIATGGVEPLPHIADGPVCQVAETANPPPDSRPAVTPCAVCATLRCEALLRSSADRNGGSS